jgi:hypothetical protein
MLKSSVNEIPFNGIFSDSLQEISLFQHLSYLSYDNNNNNGTVGNPFRKRRVFQLFFLEPLGFINLTRDTSAVGKEEEGEGDEDDEEDEDELMMIEKEEEEQEHHEGKDLMEETTNVVEVASSSVFQSSDPFRLSSSAPQLSPLTPITTTAAIPSCTSLSAEKREKEKEKEKEKPSSLIKQQKKPSSSASSSLPFIKCLLFTPVHISLSSLLERKAAASSSSKDEDNNNPLISPVLAMQWIVELMIIIDYLSNCGIALKYLSLEDLFITSEGTLKIGGLQGATMISSYQKGEKDEERTTASSVEAVSLKKKKISKNSSSLKEDEIWSGIIPLHQAYLTAPEVLFGDTVSYSSSIYCLGTMAYYLLTGKPLVKVLKD